MRGYACVALDNPKHSINVGGVLRAAGCYRAALVAISGTPERLSKLPDDTMKAYRHIPHIIVSDLFNVVPYDCVPVAVDILPDAIPLPDYHHPERAFYIFGAEDATLSEHVVKRCRDKIVVPTNHCMNLAATVNVVLYDRMAKRC